VWGRSSRTEVLGLVYDDVLVAMTQVAHRCPDRRRAGGRRRGLLFKGAVNQTVATADPASRAGVPAVLFVIAYPGPGLPSIAFSLVSRHAALRPPLIGFASALSLGAGVDVAAGRGAIRTAR
jgi:hypothetical protein